MPACPSLSIFFWCHPAWPSPGHTLALPWGLRQVSRISHADTKSHQGLHPRWHGYPLGAEGS